MRLKLPNKPEILKAMDLIGKIEAHGYTALIVGGAVRDLIIDREINDIDIATNMPMDELERLFNCHDIGKSKDFGLVTVTFSGSQFEVAQFRADGKYSDGRRPDSVKIVKDFKTDASRRDFTINALGLDSDGNVIDHFGGVILLTVLRKIIFVF
jgi:tRNA nucleotidyltransferase (CCA-adding enzyme)